MNFATVILPIPVPGTFTYRIPQHFVDGLEVGSRVIVPLGKHKIHTGVISEILANNNTSHEPKEILDVLDMEPSFTPLQLNFFNWMASYYMCTLGEVLHAALPGGLKLSSESFVTIHPETDPYELDLTEREQTIMEHLSSGDMKIHEVSKAMGVQTIHQHIKNLSAKNAIQVFEKIKDKYTVKTERRIALTDAYSSEESLDQLSMELEGKQKQLDVLTTFLMLVPVIDHPAMNKNGIAKKTLIEHKISGSSLKTLIKHGIFREWEEVVPRIEIDASQKPKLPVLSPAQEKAKREIRQQFDQKDTILLKGVTGSGKTEIYISMISEVISKGGMVLYLLPEIALTTQIIKRLAVVFGNEFGVYHSRYSDNERVEVWQNVLKKKHKLVVGVRSAIFLPFSNLSLIIVDEEHENSYKQYEPAPRYHARDTAIYLASLFSAKTLLGTATPAVETYFNAEQKKFGLVHLTSRFGEVALPSIHTVDMIKSRKQKKLKGNFSQELLEKMMASLDKQKQVIIFQNRRGYAPYVACGSCGHIPKCPHCDVSLTYHAYKNILICHYCGYKTDNPSECAECHATEIKAISYGTEKLEEELEILLPEAKIGRMDLDSTRSKYSYEKIINDFELGDLDILVGTQMVTKGLDFDHVALVGILDTDRMIHFPDFRSHERAFQLLHQVSGRAGRRADRGEVLIQTNSPDQPLLQWVKTNDYDRFYEAEKLERQEYGYPPFVRLIRITIKDRDKQTSFDAASFYTREITRTLGTSRILGPVAPMIGRIRNEYLFEITVKLEKQGIKLKAVKEFLLNSRNLLQSQRLFKSVRVVFDVDPL